MKIIIEPGDMEEPEVIIRGRSGSEEVRPLLELLGGAGGISQIPLYAEEKEYFFKPEEICYFLTEGGKVNAYLESGVYAAKARSSTLPWLLLWRWSSAATIPHF